MEYLDKDVKPIELESFKQQQVVSINGVTKTLEIETWVAICPKCKTQLLQFPQGAKKVDIIKQLAKEDWHLNYCINCGQALKGIEIIDGTCEVVNERGEE